MPNQTTDKSAEEFWEGVYQKTSPRSGGNPGKVLERLVHDLAPGRALDMGCAKGDDSIWLAKMGWKVTAVDVSSTALRYAAENARRRGVADRISFEQHDLSRSVPEGKFDLVVASFFYSPTSMHRTDVLQRAASSVVPDGHLLIIDHGSRAPWSWAAPGTAYPTAAEAHAALGLNPDHWREIHVADIERLATGPNGRQAKVLDSVIFLARH